MPLRIGTRRSALALWQAQHVETLLKKAYPNLATELVFFTTEGDRSVDKPLPEIGGKGVFTLELENGLREGTIDIAVHSLKDLPTKLDEAFALGAIPPRGDPFDALVSRDGQKLDALPTGAVIGTSSLRRSAQLKAYRADLQIKTIRGNVDTRLRKTLAADGDYDAAVMAVAGLMRLNRQDAITETIDNSIMLPAPGQGALAVQCGAEAEHVLKWLEALDHAETRICVNAERVFLQHLEAGCRLPVSAYASLEGDTLTLTGRVNSVDGQETITVQGQAKQHESSILGQQLAAEALARGASHLLAEIRNDL